MACRTACVRHAGGGVIVRRVFTRGAAVFALLAVGSLGLQGQGDNALTGTVSSKQ